eukprot:1741343-Rhodomonas_salina.4
MALPGDALSPRDPKRRERGGAVHGVQGGIPSSSSAFIVRYPAILTCSLFQCNGIKATTRQTLEVFKRQYAFLPPSLLMFEWLSCSNSSLSKPHNFSRMPSTEQVLGIARSREEGRRGLFPTSLRHGSECAMQLHPIASAENGTCKY